MSAVQPNAPGDWPSRDPDAIAGIDGDFEDGMVEMRLECWTIRQLDEGRFEARLYINARRTGASLLASSIERLRRNLPPDLERFPALPGDAPDVLENWI